MGIKSGRKCPYTSSPDLGLWTDSGELSYVDPLESLINLGHIFRRIWLADAHGRHFRSSYCLNVAHAMEAKWRFRVDCKATMLQYAAMKRSSQSEQCFRFFVFSRCRKKIALGCESETWISGVWRLISLLRGSSFHNMKPCRSRKILFGGRENVAPAICVCHITEDSSCVMQVRPLKLFQEENYLR